MDNCLCASTNRSLILWVAGLGLPIRLGGSETGRPVCCHQWGSNHSSDDYRDGKVMSRKDVLNHKPCRTDSEEVKWFYEDEIVVITYPKKFGKMEKWLQNRIGGPEEVRRPLDKFSSYIWEICDGKTTVAEVVRKFDEKFGEEVAPASDRVQIFLETLLGLNLIELK